MAEKSEKRRIYIYINGKEVEDNLRSLTSQSRKLRNELAGLTPGTKKFVAASKNLQKVNGRIKSIRRNVSGLGGTFGSLKKAIGSNLFAMVGWGAAISGVISVVRDAFNRIREFDKEMFNLAAISGKSRKELEPLEETIKQIAGKSIKTSNEVAKLATTLIALGKTPEEVQKLLKPANDLSIALQASSDDAGQLLVSTLNAFGKGSKSGQHFADVIANMRSSTSLDFERIKDSLGFVSATAHTLGLTLGKTGALIGVLQDNGVKAARAGRLLNTSFIKLSTEGKTLEGALKRINDAKKEGKTGSELLAIANKDFGKQSAALGVILAANTNKIKSLTNQFDNLSDGSLKKLTDEQLKSLDAKMKILDSTWENFILNIDNGNGVFSKTASSIIDYTTSIIKSFTAINNSKSILAAAKKTAVQWGVMTGVLSEKQANFTNNITKNNAVIDVLKERLKNGTITAEKYAVAVKLIGKGWLDVKHNTIKAVDTIVTKTDEELIAEEKAAEEKNKIKAKAAAKAKKMTMKTKADKMKSLLEEQKVIDDVAKNRIAAANKEIEDVKAKEKTILEIKRKAESDKIMLIQKMGIKKEELNAEDLAKLKEFSSKELEYKLALEQIAAADKEEKRIEKETKFLEDKQSFQDKIELINSSGIEKELTDVDVKYEALYVKAEKYGIATGMLQKTHAAEITAINKKYSDKQTKEVIDSERKKRAARKQAVGAFGDILDQMSQLAKKGSAEQKVLALSSIGVDTALAIASLTANSEANPANAVSFGAAGIAQFAAGLVRILANIAAAKNLLTSNGKSKGGYTGDGFGTPDESGYKVAGYVHQDEWVAPEWMTKSPIYADTIGMLETARQSKTGYAAGGPVNTTADVNTIPETISSSTAGLEAAINTLNQHLANGIKAQTVIDQNNLIDLQTGLNELTLNQ